jgi:acetoin utilization protein AcuB
MTSQLITVSPKDTMMKVKEIFDIHRIHHIPVVKVGKIVGMISKGDILQFASGLHHSAYDSVRETSRLENYCAEDIMTKGLAKLDVDDRINVAIEVFRENLFHALPVMRNNELAGIVTTFDIIRMLSDEDNQRIASLRSHYSE